jgi:hypothetical protein
VKPALRGAAEELRTVRRAAVLLLRAMVLRRPLALQKYARLLPLPVLESLLPLLLSRPVCAGARDRRGVHGGVCGAGRPGLRRRLPSWLAHPLQTQCLRVLRVAQSRLNQTKLARISAL